MHVHEYISYTEQKLERLSKTVLIGKNVKNINGKLVTFLLSNGF